MMKPAKRLFVSGGLILFTLLVSAPVYAECGSERQCIAVGLTESDALVAHHAGSAPKTPILNFGSQPSGTTSASQTIYVAAVTGPVSTMAVLGAITLSGVDAADFSITGGTCSTTNGPIHGGASCTITVAFSPATAGVKTAVVNVPLNPPPPCGGCITGRTINLTGTAGYPDVALDTTVATTLAAQTETAQRFSTAQITNFQHRMESLHRGGSNVVNTAFNLENPTGENAVVGARFIGRSNVNNRPINRTPTNSVRSETLLANEVVALMTTQSVNLANLSDTGAATETSRSTANAAGFWTAGIINFGTHDATNTSTSLDFTTNGISLGFDRRLGEQWAVGLGLGFARDKTNIGAERTLNRTQGSSITVYSSYQPSQRTFVDGMIGVGSLKFATQRYVSAVNNYARSDRDGSQLFASLATGYEYHDEALLISPYARLDHAKNRLKQSTETGAGQFDLSYFSQTSSATQGALGVRATSVHPTRFGSAAPRIRAEYQHNFQGTRTASVVYADQPGGTLYAIPGVAAVRNAMLLGVGNDFVMRNGTRIGLDYQVLHTFSQDTNYAVLLQYATNFDGQKIAATSGGKAGSLSAPLGIQVDAGYTFDDNVTRAKTNKLVDSSTSFNLGKTAAFRVGSNARVLLTGTLGSEKFYRYDGLSRISGGVLSEFQYRSSSEFSAPTLGVFARAFADQYNSALRDGYRYSTGVSLLQPVTDRIRLFSALARNQRHGKNAVFNNRDNSVRVNLDYELSSVSTMYLGGEYRRGHVVSASTTAGAYGTSDTVVADDAYLAGQLFSYRLEGSTVLTTLGYNLGVGPRDSFDFSWRRVRSAIAAANVPVANYTSNQVSVAYLIRF